MPRAQKKELTPADKRAIAVKEEIMDRLNEMMDMGVSALSKSDKEFIRARVSYLTGDMREEFAPVFKEAEREKAEGGDMADLKDRAKALGIKYVGVKREDLEKAVAEAESVEE